VGYFDVPESEVYTPEFTVRAHTMDRQSPVKIGARNSSFASFDLGVGGRLRGSASQPDAQAHSRGRNTYPNYARRFSRGIVMFGVGEE
jgi:hypothetical protein